MDQARLHELEEQCIQNCAPPCSAHCPAHVNIRQMLLQVTGGDFTSAYATLRKSLIFPEIIARTCDQPCQVGCNRENLGGSLQVSQLELAICRYADKTVLKSTPLPKKRGRVAVIGGGICGSTASLELQRKGYFVTLYDERDFPGGKLWSMSEHVLPHDVILREMGILNASGIEMHLQTRITPETFDYHEYDAVLIATGGSDWNDPGLKKTSDGHLVTDPVTFQTNMVGVFAGGSVLHSSSTVLSLSDGRRAAISIDRYLQRVSMTASRTNEGAYETRLYTNLTGIEPVGIVSSDPDEGYSREDAQAEAKRCLQCECMECVKVCEYLSAYGGYPGKYVRDVYNNMSIIMRQRTANKFINSCTLCGLCKVVCPTDLDMGEVIQQARQTMVQTNKMPISAHDFALRDMAFSNSDRFYAVLAPADGSRCEYAFFPGCQLAASNPEYIPLIYADLQKQLPGLGVMLGCCGAPADWSGEMQIFDQAADVFREQWEGLGKPKLVLACTSCLQEISKILPEVAIIPLWEVLLSSLYKNDARKLTGRRYAIHDPCTSRHAIEWHESVRGLLTALEVEQVELEYSREKTECCGYGGVVWLANPDMVHRIIQRRINENETDYLTYCVMCRDLFAAEGKTTLHLLDLLYAKDLDVLATRKSPDYSQRHENRMRVKKKMMKLMAGKDFGIMEDYEKINLLINEQLRASMEDRLILIEDIQKVIDHAEKSGESFINQQTGHFLVYHKPNLITYWVEYTKQEDVFIIHDAYSHRMQVGGDTSV